MRADSNNRSAVSRGKAKCTVADRKLIPFLLPSFVVVRIQTTNQVCKLMANGFNQLQLIEALANGDCWRDRVEIAFTLDYAVRRRRYFIYEP